MLAITPTLRDRLCAGRGECCERLECCRVLSVPMFPILAYYTNPIIDAHSVVTHFWYVATLELDILALRRLDIVAERGQWGTTVVIHVSFMAVLA